MPAIHSSHLSAALQLSGFRKSPGRPKLFLLDDRAEITPAYYLQVFRKQNMVRFGGAIGIYFREFEELWWNSLSKEERRIDATLPMIMAIDNYEQLFETEVFKFTADFDKIYEKALDIYRLCASLPHTIDELNTSFMNGEILGKTLSDYLHISEYLENDNLYLRKSSGFIQWFIDTWPEYRYNLLSCLTDAQLRRLGVIRA